MTAKASLSIGTLPWRSLDVFRAVASRRSFVAAARELGTSSSAVSQSIAALEQQLGATLLIRNTRSVNVTTAGQELLTRIGSAMDDVYAAVAGLGAERAHQLQGRLRFNVPRFALAPIFARVVPAFAKLHPSVEVEVDVEPRFIDIVAAGYDAGVRMHEDLERDMVAVRLLPAFRFVVVGSPAYLERHGRPKHPRDLTQRQCIRYRLPASGELYTWEFEQRGRSLRVRVNGALSTNSDEFALQLAAAGLGLAYVPEPHAQPFVEKKTLEVVLSNWAAQVPGAYLYFPKGARRNHLLRAFIEVAHSVLATH